jgi:uncharacterized protein (DUF2252 family)
MHHQDLSRLFFSKLSSVEDQYKYGKSIRNTLSFNQQNEFIRSSHIDPIKIFAAQAKSRDPLLVPLRHERMLTSPYAFFRASAELMAHDLSSMPSTQILVQSCGDMHVGNFGVYASVERNMVFGINDFDETYVASWEWDIKRLVASAVIAVRYINGTKLQEKEAAYAIVESYKNNMREYRKYGALELWYTHIDEEQLLDDLSDQAKARAIKILEKSKRNTPLSVLNKLKYKNEVNFKNIDTQTLSYVEDDLENEKKQQLIEKFLNTYLKSITYEKQLLLSQYRITDVVRKVVGVGSIGIKCWVVLLEGTHALDPIFLQIKEARDSVLQKYFEGSYTFQNNGHRIVAGQRVMQCSPDTFLGWGKIKDTAFYVRQLRDKKGGIELEPGVSSVSNFIEYCKVCGWALALAHAKSGKASQIAGYMGKSDQVVESFLKFGVKYANQNDADFETFKKAVKKGILKST